MLNTQTFAGVDMKVYTTFTADIDLVADGPTAKAPRQVIVLDAGGGNLTVTTAHATRTLPADLLVKVPITCGVLAITDATDAGSVLVIW